MDRLFQAVGGIGCCVLLTDRNGVPVERRGAPADDAQFRDWGLWTGTVWSEESEGTNGIGTALERAKPTLVVGGEHFSEQLGIFDTPAPPAARWDRAS